MSGVVDCWTKGPGVQGQVAENVVSLGDRHGPVIRLSSQRVLTDEQCVDLRERILSRHFGCSLTFSRGSGKVKTMA